MVSGVRMVGCFDDSRVTWWMVDGGEKVQEHSVEGATPLSHAKRLEISVGYGQKLATLPERR